MRLFVSVDLDGLEEEVAAAQAPLRDLPGLNLTDPEQAHVTMKFLGEGDHDLEALNEAVDSAVKGASVDPFEARFEGLGVFPSLDYISVVWLGIQEGSEPLIRLHEALEIETTELGYDEERHDFTPHATLARMDHAAAKEDIQHYVREEHPGVGSLEVEELRLKKSDLTSEGPEYETLERVPL
jgi:2'-5' RNA ligase